MLNLQKNTEVFLACETEPEEAEIILFGAAFDGTTSYRPGTRFGPAAIRHESYGLESYSPYQDKDLEDCRVADIGDPELSIGDVKLALGQIKETACRILAAGKLPFMLGGEHLVTLPVFEAALAKYPDLCLIHFDAHADLRDDYLGVKLSHACVMRRCLEAMGEKAGAGRLFQFGIRSGTREEFAYAKEHCIQRRFDFRDLAGLLLELKGRPIYFTLDLDVLDPAVLPGTGTPEPGGVSFEELRQAASLICQNAQVVACDVNELSPAYDPSGVSTAVAGKIVREMLLALSGRGAAEQVL